MKDLYSYSFSSLKEEMLSIGEKEYRAKQLYSWIYKKRVKDFSLFSDISKNFISYLQDNYYLSSLKTEVVQKSSDGTIKCLFSLEDNQKVEAVLMHYVYGYSVCISSQVGCNMSCAFCASGLLKKRRNLTSGEMIRQVLFFDEMLKKENKRVSHVVIMGTGEPFDNYDNVLEFVKTINCPYGLDIGARHITISTCGVIPGIQRFKEENLQVNLAISLHAATDELRDKLMPINRIYPLSSLIPAIIQYEKKANRKVTFEYIMIKDVNDSFTDLKNLINLIYPTGGYVNLIPYNPVVENGFKRSDDKTVNRFHNYLLQHGVKSTIRKEFGSDIDAACGQLRAKHDARK
ncbi:MAG: 23S rRNA (adenine(2503)-C(2))-methyltransferase RlmN [Candidatus Enterosoma sp.]|nr:23S rRNA (adenine(2503)-C(2))-methyltransferase RlmN [bacterium]MDY5866259.1 23S rRNA (adenine(2503)-C(2))-methyltransferase RlmN [Candidatus Enterosoma sp.]